MDAAISFVAKSTEPVLHLKIWLDNQIMHETIPAPAGVIITITVDDSTENEHLLVFEMSGKTSDHTKLDNHGHIIQDVVLELSDFKIDGLELGHLFHRCCSYIHDYNGTTDTGVQNFLASWAATAV